MVENNNNKPDASRNQSKAGIRPRKFKAYWIYGVVIVVFVIFQILSFRGGPVETNWSEVENMVKEQDIENIIIVNKKVAQIYLKETSYEKYIGKLNESNSSPSEFGPHFSFEIESFEVLLKNIRAIQKESSNPSVIGIDFQTDSNHRGQIIGWLIPIIFIFLFLALIIFVLRNVIRSRYTRLNQRNNNF